jgi:hypothetical protein
MVFSSSKHNQVKNDNAINFDDDAGNESDSSELSISDDESYNPFATKSTVILRGTACSNVTYAVLFLEHFFEFLLQD